MSTRQPTRVGCTTSERFHLRCWHFCSCSSHKTIPSIESLVTRLFILGSMVTAFSFRITEVFVFIARIDWKIKRHEFSLKKSVNMVNYILLTMDSSIRICVSSFFNSALKNNFRQQRTKSHISAFLKCDGDIEVHVSATFMFCGNVLYQVLAIPSSFRHISGSEMSSDASVILSQDVSAVIRSRYVSANGFFNMLVESLQWKQTDHGFVYGSCYFNETEMLGNCTYIFMKS